MPSLIENAQKKLKIKSALILVGSIWAVHLLSIFLALPFIDIRLIDYGLLPRSFWGLFGIVTMPFLHANLGHLVANTIPLLVLLILLAGSRDRPWEIVAGVALLGGAFLWIAGRGAVHVGASGLVAGLIVFLVLNGVFERRVKSVLIAIITFFLYGGTLFWGIIPTDREVSWDGHLCGAVAGGLLAFALSGSWKRGSRDKEIAE